MALALSDLLSPLTADEVMTDELAIATTLGLTVTAWQPVSVARAIYQTNAQVIANLTNQMVTNIAAGGFATTAAALPTFTWMDLVSEQVYNVTRIPATQATLDSTEFTVTNSSGAIQGPFAINELLFVNPATGKQFQNTAAVTLALGANGVAIEAQEAGAASTSGPGTITQLATPIVGVTCTNSAAAVGTDAETNAQLLQRDQAKLGALSPNGPAQAYYFVATSLLDSTQPFYNANLSEPITRVSTVSSPARVKVYLANAAGAPSAPDVAIVDAAFQVWCVPLGTTATAYAAGETSIAVTATVYIPSSAGVDATQLQTAIGAALATYFESIPIGGVTGSSPNIVPRSQIIAVIDETETQIADIVLTLPATDTSVPTTKVPVLGAVSISVVVTT